MHLFITFTVCPHITLRQRDSVTSQVPQAKSTKVMLSRISISSPRGFPPRPSTNLRRLLHPGIPPITPNQTNHSPDNPTSPRTMANSLKSNPVRLKIHPTNASAKSKSILKIPKSCKS